MSDYYDNRLLQQLLICDSRGVLAVPVPQSSFPRRRRIQRGGDGKCSAVDRLREREGLFPRSRQTGDQPTVPRLPREEDPPNCRTPDLHTSGVPATLNLFVPLTHPNAAICRTPTRVSEGSLVSRYPRVSEVKVTRLPNEDPAQYASSYRCSGSEPFPLASGVAGGLRLCFLQRSFLDRSLAFGIQLDLGTTVSSSCVGSSDSVRRTPHHSPPVSGHQLQPSVALLTPPGVAPQIRPGAAPRRLSTHPGVGVSVGVVVKSAPGLGVPAEGETVNVASAACVNSGSLKVGEVTGGVPVSGVPVPGVTSGDGVPVVGTSVPGVPVTSAVGEN